MIKFPSQVMFLGDIHGNQRAIIIAIKKAVEHNIKYIIQLGDMGVYMLHPSIQSMLMRNDIHLYFIGGNHENWDELDCYAISGELETSPHIHYMPTGTEFTIGELTGIVAGGAISIDQADRTEGQDWFVQEGISQREAEMLKKSGFHDIVLSHDCPASVSMPPECTPLSMAEFFGEEVIYKCQEHRELLDDIVKEINPQFIFHGHYHHYYTLWCAEYFGCQVTGLNMEMRQGSALLFDTTTEMRTII